ncbi:MAG: ABC transporter substrate-binding protein [Lachnospiraceae bacterium]|nr:ABC transporter substrate-binding protein [Lachnospiraceae bacterium]MDD3615439.1 ABC transporter substrate-binding protein [Lachnospiraceae bacterium]
MRQKKRILKKTLVLGLAATFTAGVMTGCGSSSSSGTDASGAADSASETTTSDDGGKTLTFGCQNYGAGGIDPAVETNQAWNCMRYGIGQCLFQFDDTMQVQPWLCDSYEVSDDHKTWTFHIREGVKFSDGCDMTAQSVADSFKRLFTDGESGSSAPEKYLEKEAAITADDAAGTVTIVTQTAYPDLTKNLAYPVMAIVDVADTQDYAHGTIGTGPYVAKEYTEEVGYTLTANENYWDGEVPYDSVELLYMGDASAKAMALKSGQVDLVENITTVSDLEELEADENYTVTIANGVRCGFAYINQGGILGNKDLREAVIQAVDEKTMCETTVGGLYTYGFSVLPSNLAYNYDKLSNPFEYNQEEAKAKLDAAGIVDSDGDGIRELDGENISLKFITYENRALSTFAEGTQQLLAEIGIGVEVNNMDSESEWNEMVNGNYDLCSSNWTTVGTGDPTEYLDNWYGKSTANYCGYENEEYDKLYEQLLVELDDAKRTELITQMQQVLVDDAAVLVHGYYNSSMISSKAVANANIHTADYYWLTTEITPAN